MRCDTTNDFLRVQSYLYTLDEDQLRLVLSRMTGWRRRDGQIVNRARVIAAVSRLERVDAQQVRVRIDLNGFNRPAGRANRTIVDCPAKWQGKVAFGDGASQR